MTAAGSPRILVIKLGALGDFVQAMGPAAAIRAHHPDAAITLLTGAGFADLARRAPYFDAVWVDERPRLFNPLRLLALRRRLRGAGFARVYDLQTSDRSSFYFRLMGPGRRPEWSGIARGASHPHGNPRRDFMHTIARQAEQLASAGIAATPLPDVAWAAADFGRFALPPGPCVILVPGGAAHRPAKRWPVEHYAALAQRLADDGIVPIVIGGKDERKLGAAIAASCATACDLTGDTSLGEIVGLARRATRAIGNDTGPMHLLVAAGCPATVLYSAASDPALTQPYSADVVILRRDDLAALSVAEVAATLAMH